MSSFATGKTIPFFLVLLVLLKSSYNTPKFLILDCYLKNTKLNKDLIFFLKYSKILLIVVIIKKRKMWNFKTFIKISEGCFVLLLCALCPSFVWLV